MKNRNYFSCLFFVICCLTTWTLVLSACFAPLGYNSGDTTLSVGFGGSRLPRTTIYPEELTYELTFSGPGGRTIIETANWGETTTVQVVPGSWSISVQAFNPVNPGTLQAIGEYSIDVRAGVQNTADIKMAVYREVNSWAELTGVISANLYYDVFIVIKDNFAENPASPISISNRTVTIAADETRTINLTGSASFFSISDNGHLIIGSRKYSGNVIVNGTTTQYIVNNTDTGTLTMFSGEIRNDGTGDAVSNNGTFSMSGSAFADTVYLVVNCTITITGTLTRSIAANIKPANFIPGTQLLSGSSGLRAANYHRFNTIRYNVALPNINSAGSLTSIMEMVRISGGSFTMGSPVTEIDRDPDEGPQRQVTLSAFYMGRFQVTQDQYVFVMENNPSYHEDPTNPPASGEEPGRRPVELVNWYDALVFANRLSILEGLNPVYSINSNTNPDSWGQVPNDENPTWNAVTMNINANGYRMPTEAEWEYACRAGTTTAWSYGNTANGNYIWFSENSGDITHEVGKKLPNPWGLYDMHGNVFEWVWDAYDEYYPPYSEDNPTGPSVRDDGSVARGGSYSISTPISFSRSASRGYFFIYQRSAHIGLRLVRR